MEQTGDHAALQAALLSTVRGEVRFDRLSRTIYSTDASIYEITPDGVVLPRCVEDVVATVRACREHGVAIVARGAGTGIAGGAVGGGVQIDFSRFLNRIGAIDVERRTVVVEPGVVLDELNAALAPHGLHFAPDVATSSRATIGGMIANNSCGAHSVYYGRTVDHVADLTMVLSDGSLVTWAHHPFGDFPDSADQLPVFELPSGGSSGTLAARVEVELDRVRRDVRDEVLKRYPRVMRRNGGYALDRLCLSAAVNPATLLCGSEGTLGLVVGATLRLSPLPKHKVLTVLHFDSVLEALGATALVLEHRPAAVELVDRLILSAGAGQIPSMARDAFLVGEPAAVLVCELYDDDEAELRRRMERLERALAAKLIGEPRRQVFDREVQQAVWELRNKGFGLLMSRPGDRQPYEFIEDAAVEPRRLRDYIERLGVLLSAEGVSEVGYYAHASVGVIHVRPVLNLKRANDVARMRRIAERTCELVLEFGGALTGEHGDGLVRSEWLERMYGPAIVAALRRIKDAFDPQRLFNPGKIVDPRPMTENLRYGEEFRSAKIETYFDYGEHGGMAGMAGMCSGVGQCRQKLDGAMCPSYMATLDETHTTRARANALRVALSNRGLIDGLDDPALSEVMELCLACKACKSECPTGVDMARMKAEWLFWRNERHGVSSAARFVADAPGMTRRVARFPRIANLLLQNGWVRRALEKRFGLDHRIAPPRLAKRTFRHWFDSTPRSAGKRGRVAYFIDTWTNYYWPEAGVAAVRLLEAAGFEVRAPKLLCCGRPLISQGLLGEAAEVARENVDRLKGVVEAGFFIVGSEPSCILSLLDEYPQLVRTDYAQRLAGRVRCVESLLADVVREDRSAIPFSSEYGGEPRRVLYHGHCHQKALVGAADALTLLNAPPGLVGEEINSGCCGMAGSFGHEVGHYEIARAVGEQRLFPAVQGRGDAEIAVSGFSCREQIAHHTGLTPRHVLELAADALPD